LAAGAATSAGPIAGCPDLIWGTLPPAGSPDYPDRESLCASIPGEPLPPDLLPPEDLVSLDEQNAYADRLSSDFVRPRRYATELGWVGDAHWRLSGDIEGCPSANSFATFGVHLLVRVWYSPEVVEWLCGDRSTELPVGATVVKEEHLFRGDGIFFNDPATNENKKQLPFDKDDPFKELGVRFVTENGAGDKGVALGVNDVALTKAEFSGLSGMQQMIKHNNSIGGSSFNDAD
jgi:hypothetical protein